MDLVGGSEESTARAIEKLVSLLTEEARLFRGIERSDIKSLENELESIRLFLRDADARSGEEELSDALKDWLNQSKEVAELIEDVVEKHILKASQRQNQRGFISFLGRVGRLIGTLNDRRRLHSDIKNIKALLRQILEQGQSYSISHRVSHNITTVAGRYRDPLFVPLILETTVGIDSATNELVQRLVEGASRRSVISLVGIGGIGKSTLAKKVHENEVVREHFDCLAWIDVTRSYSTEDLLGNMVRQIAAAGTDDVQQVCMTRREQLIDTLTQFLRSKRYLLVFDDAKQEKIWREVRHALPDNEVGSRIIITTRSDAVAASCEESSFDHVHRLEPLSAAMSWKLFCSRAFRNEHEQNCPPELEQLSRQISSMCGGLPLAIIVIAGLFSTHEKTVLEWQRLLNFHFQLKSDPHFSYVSKILALSFHDLPYQLKMCFLYFSIFPKGSLIPNDKLLRLWIAESFVEENGRMTLEEVSEGYLNELTQRNLVEVCEGFNGLEKFCRVHDLMHEIARQKADEFSFCQIRGDKSSSLGEKSCRLLITIKIKENDLETIEESQVRSVFLSNIGSLNNSFVVTLFRKYNLLTLLDFENVSLNHLPEEVGNLIHLKYLSLKDTKVKRLPKSVGKLLNLQTLDLRNTLLVELPVEVNMLQNLRHLLVSCYDSNVSMDSTQGVRIMEGIGYLESLQTLMTMEANLSGIGVIKELKNLSQLRRLGIARLTTELASALCTCITEMSQLESLSLHSMNDFEMLDLENISFAPLLLQQLVLKGRLRRFPNWVSSLLNLSMLCLSLSRLDDVPLRHISDLPNLVSLWLYRAYEGEQLHFEVGGFKKLKLLVLRDLQRLEVVEIDEGALPLLEELRIGPSSLLSVVPSGIQYLRSLKVLAFYDMPNELVLSMQPNGGSEYVKVEHVPSVLFWYRVRGRSYAKYELDELELLDRLQGLATNITDVVQNDLLSSFYYSDDEAGTTSASTSTFPRNDMQLSISYDRMSFASNRFSFFSDNIED